MTFRTTVFLAFLLAAHAAAAGMNPTDPGFPGVTTVFGGTYDNNFYSAMCVACHTRNPSARTQDVAGLGSHFIYGGPTLLTGNKTVERLTAWNDPPGGTGGVSRYGRTGDNTNVVGATGEMICESCHNLLKNNGPNKLLAIDNEAIDPNALCEGCHIRTGPGHHIMTGETSTLHTGTLSNADDMYVRNPPLTGSEATYPGPNGVNCWSCHKAHDAQTQAGARILKRGYRTGDNAAVQGVGVTGMERAAENPVNPGTRIVTDFEPLCNACHKTSF